MAGSGLSALLEPASIAIVGASSRHGHFGNQALVNLRTFGFRGRVYAVNPRRSEIEGVACFPTIADLPEAVDHAVIVLPADRAPGAVLQCGARGIPTATVVASGFAETGDEAGVALQANLASAIAETGVRVCGPNTLGTANFVTGAVPFVSGNLPDEPPGRGVAIVSQSGGIGFTILNRAFSRGAGCGHLVVAGNELDIAIPELVEALLGAEGVRALAVYIEAVRDPEGLLTAARRALEADIPVVVLKAGRSAAGARAAAAHTGALASSGAVFDGVLRQAGCVIASSLDELIGAAALFGRHGRARGTRLGVYGMGGGLSVLMADLVDGAGLELPAPAPETRDRLKAILPDTTPGNPFDSGGQFLTARGEPLLPGALTAFAADDAFDAMVYACMPVLKTRERIYGEAIVAAAAAIDKPQVALHYGAPPLTAGMTDLLRRAGLVVLDPPEAGVRALQRWATWRPDEVEAAPPPPPIAPLAALVRLRDLRAAGRAVVTEHVAAGLLEDAGVPVARARVAHSPEEAIALAAVLAGPDGVAMKALSAQVTHRARAGALVLGVTEGAAAAAYRRIVERVAAIPGAILEGVLVQEMLPPGPELMAGLKMDPQFGPVVLAGLGGVLVERLGRVAIRRGPVGATGALAMLREVGLEDAGALAGGLAAILDALAALAAGAGGLLSEIDCNPLLVDADGRLRAADALITLA